MATYYVRPDGNDSNAGTGSTSGTAWRTIGKALSATGIASGDIVYVAPGLYTESINVAMTSATSTTQIIGDPTCTFFTGVTSGVIKLSTLDGTGSSVYTSLITATSKNFISFNNIYFEYGSNGTALSFTTCTNLSFTKCVFVHCGQRNSTTVMLRTTAPASTNANLQISQSVFFGGYNQVVITNIVGINDTSEIKTSLFNGCDSNALSITGKTNITNCTLAFTGTGASGVFYNTGSATFPSTVKNSIFAHNDLGIYQTTTGSVVETYNRFIGNNVARTGVATGTGSTTTGNFGFDLTESLLYGLNNSQPFASFINSINTGFGITSGAPTSDLYSINWTGTSPDAGSATYRSLSSIGNYLPTERNASTITIAPGSTSQSIELYLGATGLTFATSGLSAYYVRNRSAPVAITLVTQTATGSWASGGFAEISSSLTPGVYRLDVPDAAFAAGSSDVTIVVRGASGTNGAVLTVTLSSGGLTAAQTGAAVWGTSPAGYVDATTMGGILTETNGLANGIDQEVGEIPILVWDEQLSSHTTAGTTGQRLNANVLADELLAREIGSGSGAGAINERTVRSALRGLRNKTTVINNEMTVYKEDDASTAWSATVSSSDSSKTITGVDPS